MNNLFGSTHAPTFDDPLAMLRACHGRIEAQCATLIKLLDYLPSHGCDAQVQQASRAVLRYFDTAGQYHHQDEESDLFPTLLSYDNAESSQLVIRLLEEHKVMEQAWHALRPVLVDLAEGKSRPLPAPLVQTFNSAYAHHIELENSQLLPLAERILNSEQLTRIGQNMAQRRQAPYPNEKT